MVVIVEQNDFRRASLDGSHIDAFTQKSFSDLIRDAHTRKHDYFLGKVTCASKAEEAIQRTSPVYFYDARQLCKHVFEMVISPDGRKIQIKNFNDPKTEIPILDLSFYKMRYDSETPLRAEYVGNHTDFLESNCFRSRIFFREDPLDALNVNFDVKKKKKMNLFNTKQLISLIVTLIFVVVLTCFLVLTFEREHTAPVHPKRGAVPFKKKANIHHTLKI